MLFNSLEFIVIFLPIVIFLNYFLNKKNIFYSKILLIFTSLIFYGAWNIKLLPLLIFSILVNFILSNLVIKSKNYIKKIYVFCGVSLNILVLGIFKYTNFFIENYNFLFSSEIKLLNLIFPLGLSFYTIQQISYLIDCSEGEVKKTSFLKYFTFVSFFPQLIAGPIILYKDFEKQIRNLVTNKKHKYFIGLLVFTIGLSKKLLIADTLQIYVDENYLNISNLSAYKLLLTSYCFTFQIYFDFSGYTDMALGLGLLFGIKFPNNFNSPFISTSMIEFWRRWHITLSKFIQIYIYQKIVIKYKNLTIFNSSITIIFVMFLAGIWHGPTWMYALFGLAHGLGIAVNYFWKRYCCKIPIFLSWLITFNFVNFTFVIFRSQDLNQLVIIFKKLINLKYYSFHFISYFSAKDLIYFIFLIGIFFITFKFENSEKIIKNKNLSYKKIIFFSLVGSLSIFKLLLSTENNSFVYFDF